MRQISASQIRGLATNLEVELNRLRQLELGMDLVKTEIVKDPERAFIYYESLALKLHNFYTGCEQIFRLIITEFNQTFPSGYDWHKRLLYQMANQPEEMPALLSQKTVIGLQAFLEFRYIVRHIYGFELDLQRVEKLVKTYPSVWHQFNQEVRQFIHKLRDLAEDIENNLI